MGPRTLIPAMARDARFGLRSLWSARALAAAAAVVLALGIGANVAIFAVVEALVLRPLPFRDPDRLAVVFETLAGRRPLRLTASAPAFDDLRRSGAFEEVAALARTAGSLDRGDHAEAVRVAHATWKLFGLLGIEPQIGRVFAAGEERVALVSDGLYRSRLRADPTLLGRSITLDGVQRTVVGVLPPRLSSFFPGDVWVPLALTEEQLQPSRREHGMVLVLARTREDSQERVADLAGRVREAHPESGRAGFQVVPLREVFLGDLQPALLLLMGAVGLVLLVACANVANLLLARGAARQKELAVRAALGADRPTLARQLVIEGLVLASIGCVLGLLLSLWAIELLAPLGSEAIRNADVSVDLSVLLFALAISLLAGLLAGLVPALEATRPDLAAQLKDGARRGMAGSRRRVRDALVVVEVALAVVLVFAAARDYLEFRKLLRVDPGFEARGVLAMEVSLPPARFATRESQARFFAELLRRVGTLRGVEAAGFVAVPPLSGNAQVWHFDIEGPGGRGSGHVIEQLQVHTPGTLAALRVPLLRGRPLADTDGPAAPRVALVNAALARRYWPGEDAIGKRIRPYRYRFQDAAGRRFGPLDEPEAFTVVGVVADVRQNKLSMDPRPEVVLPLWQFPLPEGAIVVRGAQPEALRVALTSVDSEVAPQSLRRLTDIVAASAEQQRDPMILLGILATLALLMSGMGLYAMMSWVVAERGRELSIRMALGADSVRVLRLLLGQGMTLALSGIAFGLGAALLVRRWLPMAEASVCAALSLAILALAFLACWFPARRAARIDPRVAFRLD